MTEYNLPPYQPSHTGPLGPVDMMRIDRLAFIRDQMRTLLIVRDPSLQTRIAQCAGVEYDSLFRDRGLWYLPAEIRQVLLGAPPISHSPEV